MEFLVSFGCRTAHITFGIFCFILPFATKVEGVSFFFFFFDSKFSWLRRCIFRRMSSSCDYKNFGIPDFRLNTKPNDFSIEKMNESEIFFMTQIIREVTVT